MAESASNQYDAPTPVITDVTSREWDNLVLLYGSSGTNEITALGLRVYRTQRRWERVTNPPNLDADGGSNDTLEFGYFGEQGHSQDVAQPGDDIFRVDNERNKTIIEYGFAVEPDGVLTAIETADGSPVIGLRSGAERARGFGTADFEARGAVDAQYTRVDGNDELPTTALSPNPERQGLFRIDSKQDGLNSFRFAFSNTTNNSVDVDVTAYGMTYDVRPVNDESAVRQMVSQDGTPARKVTYGSLQNTNPNLPREWYDDTVTLEIGDVSQEP